MKNNSWIVKIEERPMESDSCEKELIISFPQELIDGIGWEVGQELLYEVVEGKLIILKNQSIS